MDSSLHITYTSTPDLTPDRARDARAHALRYALDRYLEKQKGTRTNGGEDGKANLHPVRDEDA